MIDYDVSIPWAESSDSSGVDLDLTAGEVVACLNPLGGEFGFIRRLDQEGERYALALSQSPGRGVRRVQITG